MWKKILVAVDLSPAATIVWQQALTLAKATGANLIILHVLSSDEEGAPNPLLYSVEYPINRIVVEEHQKQWEAFQTKGLKALETMKEEAVKQNIDTEIMQIFGSPGKTICEQQKKSAADLIVIGNRGFSGLKELFLGSVSNYVIHHSSCSVFIVRNLSQEI